MQYQIDEHTLREGLERAADLFKLQRLCTHHDADQLVVSVYENFGLGERARVELLESLLEMLPVAGDPLAEALMASSMSAGVLIGLLLADAANGTEPDALPDHVPADF